MPQKLIYIFYFGIFCSISLFAQDEMSIIDKWLEEVAEPSTTPDQALELVRKAVEFARTESPSEFSKALHNLGVLYDTRSDFEKALLYLDSAEVVSRSMEQFDWLTKTINSKGVVYLRQGKYDAALSNFLEVIALSDVQNQLDTKIIALRNAGHVAYYQNLLEDAMEFYIRATEIARTVGSQATIAGCYSDQALIFGVKGELEKALTMNANAARIYEDGEGLSDLNLANIYQNMGVLSKQMGKTNDAEQYYADSEAIFTSLGNDEGLAQTAVNRSELFILVGRYDLAVSSLQKALSISKRIGSNEGVMYSHMGLANAFEATGNADSALFHFKIYHEVEDSLMNSRINAQLSEMRLKYEKAENERKIELLEHDAAEQEVEIQLQKASFSRWIIVLVGSIMVIILAGGIYHLYKRNEANERKRERLRRFSEEMIKWQEDERKKVAGELHDGIGQSLVMMKNQLQRFDSEGDEQEEVVQKLENAVADTIQEVRLISYSLRPFYLDLLGLEGAVNELISDVRKSTSIKVEEKIAGLKSKLAKDQEIHMFRIFQESIQNIIKHSVATEVVISVSAAHEVLEVCISDNGVGFDSRSEFNDMRGFGLRGMKERVNILGGTLKVDSIRGNGTTLTFKIPY